MLKLNDTVVVKNDKGEVVGTKVYERVFLSHGEGDATESVDVTANGKNVGTKVRPTEASKVDANQLFTDAVAFLQQRYPKSNPLMVLLEKAEYALDLTERAAIRLEILPPKVQDADKAIDSMARKLAALNGISVAQATEQIRALLG